MLIHTLLSYLEEIAPLSLQENYDNSGLLLGNREWEIQGVLITLDITEAVIDEAIELKANLIIAHHPIIFSGIKKLNGANEVERALIKAIKNDIAIYAAHTNLDNSVKQGVNSKLAEKLQLKRLRVLAPQKQNLTKLVVFVPNSHADTVRTAIFEAGAGKIGNYDNCSFTTDGTGTFRATEGSSPFVGELNQLHYEPEIRIETVVPNFLISKTIQAVIKTHPYEEVAYDLIPLGNYWSETGAGLIGELEVESDSFEFLQSLKMTLNAGCVKYTPIIKNKIRKIAICGGSGSFLLPNAIKEGADLFISSDFKYHQFFDAENKIVIADVGHYESEQFTKELIYELVTRKFSTFAIHLSKINTNPIKYV